MASYVRFGTPGLGWGGGTAFSPAGCSPPTQRTGISASSNVATALKGKNRFRTCRTVVFLWASSWVYCAIEFIAMATGSIDNAFQVVVDKIGGFGGP